MFIYQIKTPPTYVKSSSSSTTFDLPNTKIILVIYINKTVIKLIKDLDFYNYYFSDNKFQRFQMFAQTQGT